MTAAELLREIRARQGRILYEPRVLWLVPSPIEGVSA